MLFILFVASVAVGVASEIAGNGAQSLRLPLRAGASSLGTRDDPGYGQPPLRANATQKHYLSPYTVELAVGSPPQLVYTAIDLFSNNLWLNPDCDESLSLDACCANGKYNPNISASIEDPDCSEHWKLITSYGAAAGCYVVDEVEFAGTSLGYIQVGLAEQTFTQTAGRLGLGFGCLAEDGDTSLIDRLISQGLITSRQFSIALGSANPDADFRDDSADADVGLGELLFSGLNTRKYAGELRQLYSHPGPDGDPRQATHTVSILSNHPNDCVVSNVPQPWSRAYFDYASIISYLPWAHLETLISFFPEVTYNFTDSTYQVPCYNRYLDASIGFYFDTLLIRVPLRDFILQVDGICYLGAVQNQAEEDEVILGQSFLRGAYIRELWRPDYQLGYVGGGGRGRVCLGPCDASSFLFLDFDQHQLYLDNTLYEHKHDHDALDAPLHDNHKLKVLEGHLNASLFFDAFFEDHDKSLDDLNSPLDSVNFLAIPGHERNSDPLIVGHSPVRRDYLPFRRTKHRFLLEQRLFHCDARQHKPADTDTHLNTVTFIGDIDADVRPGVDGDINGDSSLVSERGAIRLRAKFAREDGDGDGRRRHIDRLHAQSYHGPRQHLSVFRHGDGDDDAGERGARILCADVYHHGVQDSDGEPLRCGE
ncbi:aspartic peptidase domain-containing protein [Nemania sp. NC0429]|nr:aspartic peptidase domain-containing protein [Nemania sp. NC0429]